MSLPDRKLAGQLVNCTLDDGRYRLVKSLGVGTYGEVYLIHDRLAPVSSEFKAMKCIPTRDFTFTDAVSQALINCSFDDRASECMNNPLEEQLRRCTSLDGLPLEQLHDLPTRFPRGSVRQKVSRLNEEIRLHLKVPPHPNVVRLHRVLHVNDVVFMILDYVPGGDMYENIVNHPAFKNPVWPDHNEVVRDVFLQIAQAVEHCHRYGVYHRDLKPENVILLDVSALQYSEQQQQMQPPPLHHLPPGSPITPGSSPSHSASGISDMIESIDVRDRVWGAAAAIAQANAAISTSGQTLPNLPFGGRILPKFQVRIVDFGLATDRIWSNEIGCGSAYYMSCETQGGLNRNLVGYLTAPNDVWALGVILVNLASGRNPWNQAVIDDPIFYRYYMDRTFLKQALPLTDEFAQILRYVFTINPENRIKLHDLYKMVASCSRFMKMADTYPAPAIVIQQKHLEYSPRRVPAANASAAQITVKVDRHQKYQQQQQQQQQQHYAIANAPPSPISPRHPAMPTHRPQPLQKQRLYQGSAVVPNSEVPPTPCSPQFNLSPSPADGSPTMVGSDPNSIDECDHLDDGSEFESDSGDDGTASFCSCSSVEPAIDADPSYHQTMIQQQQQQMDNYHAATVGHQPRQRASVLMADVATKVLGKSTTPHQTPTKYSSKLAAPSPVRQPLQQHKQQQSPQQQQHHQSGFIDRVKGRFRRNTINQLAAA